MAQKYNHCWRDRNSPIFKLQNYFVFAASPSPTSSSSSNSSHSNYLYLFAVEVVVVVVVVDADDDDDVVGVGVGLMAAPSCLSFASAFCRSRAKVFSSIQL